jgi:hypothetical protein
MLRSHIGFDTAALVEVVADVHLGLVDAVHVRVIVERDFQIADRRVDVLVGERAGESEVGPRLARDRGTRRARDSELVRRLRTDEPYAADLELVLLRAAAEDRMILEDEARLPAVRRFRTCTPPRDPQFPPRHDVVISPVSVMVVCGAIRSIPNLCAARRTPCIAVRTGVVAGATAPQRIA